MNLTNLIRLGGFAAMVGGVVCAGVGLIEERLVEYLYYMGNINYGFIAVLLPLGVMAAIAALHMLHRERYGWVGAVVSLTAFVGLALATAALTVGVISTSPDIDSLFIALLTGLLVASVGIALMAGSPVGVFITMILSAALELEGAFALGGVFRALGGVPWVLVGLAVFRAAGKRPQQPSRGR
jgi:hypothetical protein